MYHFFYLLTKKIFRSSFDRTRKINPEEEQIIDFCPKCGDTLDDKKIITLMKHDNEKHPKTEKQQMKDFYWRGSMPMFIVLGLVVISFIVLAGISSVTSQIFQDSLSEEEKEFLKFCDELVTDIPNDYNSFFELDKYKIAKSEYVMENLEDLKKCNYTIDLVSIGDDEARIEKFRQSKMD